MRDDSRTTLVVLVPSRRLALMFMLSGVVLCAIFTVEAVLSGQAVWAALWGALGGLWLATLIFLLLPLTVRSGGGRRGVT